MTQSVTPVDPATAAQSDPGVPTTTGRFTVLRNVALVLVLLYFFLTSITLMGSAFKLFGKPFAEALIAGCSHPVVGLFIGILATGLIQSSSTTTSLVVGFVGGGVLPLTLAIPILMGANVGTTITNVLVSFGFVTRREDFRRAFAGATVHDFFNLCAVAVLFPIEVKFHIIRRSALALTTVFESAGGVKVSSPLKAIIKPVTGALQHFLVDTVGIAPLPAGIVMLILAVVVLIASLIFLVKTLRRVIVQRAEQFINRYLFRNDLTALVLGIALTICVQSSSVTTSLVVPLVAAGIVTLKRCYPYTLGANLGTTCTALLASMATVSASETGSVGVTTALAHLLFNIYGIIIFYPLRCVPIYMAEKLADIAARSKRWAIAFVFGVFFLVPLAIILLTK